MRGVGSAIPLGETACAGVLPARRRGQRAREAGRERRERRPQPSPPNGHVRAQPLSGTEPPLPRADARLSRRQHGGRERLQPGALFADGDETSYFPSKNDPHHKSRH